MEGEEREEGVREGKIHAQRGKRIIKKRLIYSNRVTKEEEQGLTEGEACCLANQR